LDLIAEGEYAYLRAGCDFSGLAEGIARDGQREPLLLRALSTPRGDACFEILDGHRRFQALKLLRRREALALIEAEEMSEELARYLTLSRNLERSPLPVAAVEALQSSMAERASLSPQIEALFDRVLRQRGKDAEQEAALAYEAGQRSPEALAGEEGEEELELEELASRVRDQLADGCNDLAALYELWGDLDEGRKEDLIECVRYLSAMLPLLEQGEDDLPLQGEGKMERGLAGEGCAPSAVAPAELAHKW